MHNSYHQSERWARKCISYSESWLHATSAFNNNNNNKTSPCAYTCTICNVQIEFGYRSSAQPTTLQTISWVSNLAKPSHKKCLIFVIVHCSVLFLSFGFICSIYCSFVYLYRRIQPPPIFIDHFCIVHLSFSVRFFSSSKQLLDAVCWCYLCNIIILKLLGCTQ